MVKIYAERQIMLKANCLFFKIRELRTISTVPASEGIQCSFDRINWCPICVGRGTEIDASASIGRIIHSVARRAGYMIQTEQRAMNSFIDGRNFISI